MNTNDKFKSLEPLLEIKNLKVQFPSRKKMLTAVDGVNLTIKPGEIVGVVGESGSGKVLCLSQFCAFENMILP